MLVHGTALNDVIVVTANSVTVNGQRLEYASVDFLVVDAGDGDDEILVDGSHTTIRGGAGDDHFVIRATGGSTLFLDGMSGSDQYDVEFGALTGEVVIHDSGVSGFPLADGSDVLRVIGTVNNDFINVTDSAFTFEGLSVLESEIVSHDGLEQIYLDTGFGSDSIRLLGSPSSLSIGFFIHAGDGNDVVTLEREVSKATGPLAALTANIFLDEGDDEVRFVDGNTLNGVIDGGLGFDELNARFVFSTALTIDLLNRSATMVQSGLESTFLGIEAAFGGALNDRLIGDGGNNRLRGGGGNDTLDGGPGDDTLDGGSGDDLFLLEPGSTDSVFDGLGHDTLDFSEAVHGVTIDLALDAGQRQIVDVVGNGLSLNGQFEDVIGSALSDNIRGNAADNRLDGGDGDDSIFGLAGADFLVGGDGYDFLDGGDGVDQLLGGAGSDRLHGGSGFDQLDGGAEGDVYDDAIAPQIRNADLLLSALTIDEGEIVTLSGTFTPGEIVGAHFVTFESGELYEHFSPFIETHAGETHFSAEFRYSEDDPSGTPSDLYSIIVSVSPIESYFFSNPRFVFNLFVDVLGRPADDAGRDAALDQLFNHDATRASVASSLLNSGEYRLQLVNGFYQRFLGRSADLVGQSTSLRTLELGGRQETVITSLLGSAEYFRLAGRTNVGFVNRLFEDLLHRSPGTSERSSFVTLLATQSRTMVANTILNSDEYRTLVVQGLFTQILHRPAASAESATFVSLLRGGATVENIATQLLSSAEYFAAPALVESASTSLRVNNVAPTLSAVSIAPARERSDAVLTGRITDPGGSQDTFRMLVDWGDHSSEFFVFPAGTRDFRATHRYANDGNYNVTVQVTDDDGGTSNLVALTEAISNVDIIVVGTDAITTRTPRVRVLDANTRAQRFEITPFAATFRGGVRVASGDVNGDGVPDIIVAPGRGMAPQVQVFDGLTGTRLTTPIGNFNATVATDRNGLFVAAGDVNGDGRADIIVGLGTTTANVKVFNGATGALLFNLTSFPTGFAGPAAVAAGDVNGDGRADIIVSSTATTANRFVRIFNGRTGTLLRDIAVHTTTISGGIFVAAADLNGDGRAEIITGLQRNNVASISIYDGTTGVLSRTITPFGTATRGTPRVAAVDTNSDDRSEILSTLGTGNPPAVRRHNGLTGEQIDEFFMFETTLRSGLFLG